MSKFGDLIEAPHPVLLNFYIEEDPVCEAMNPVLRKVASILGDKAKIIKIDVGKNETLTEALRIKDFPTLMIYKNGEMKWRQSGELPADTLVGLLQEYV